MKLEKTLTGYTVIIDGIKAGSVKNYRNKWQAYSAKFDFLEGGFNTRKEAVEEVVAKAETREQIIERLAKAHIAGFNVESLDGDIAEDAHLEEMEYYGLEDEVFDYIDKHYGYMG